MCVRASTHLYVEFGFMLAAGDPFKGATLVAEEGEADVGC